MNKSPENENKLPVGLLLCLKKRKLFLTEDDTNHFDCLLYGNFDGVSFQTVDKWYALAPTIEMDEGAADITGDTSFTAEPYSSTFVLKLLFPQSCPVVPYDLTGYNYQYWKAVDELERETKLITQQQPCPYFAMVMIHISKELANQFAQQENSSRNLFHYFANAIRDSRKQEGDFASLNCGLFESLGYYDYILLIRAASFQPIIQLCDSIKSLQYDGGLPAVSACYTVLGIDNWVKHMSPLQSGTPIAIDPFVESIEIAIQLCPGGSMQQLREALKAAKIEVKECRSHGKTDVLLIIDGNQLPHLLPQYLHGGILNPNHESYRHQILSKNTTFIFANDSHETDPTLQMPKMRSVDSYHSIFAEYKKLRQEDEKSHRLTTALRQTVLRYLNLTQSNHAFELQHLLDPIFDSLFRNMNRANKTLQKLFQKWHSAHGDPDLRLQLQWKRAQFWDEYDTALRSFRELVGGFLSDIALSDKYFIDDSQLKHPSIGSATKFIFMYNYLVASLAREIHEGTQTTYTFFVKSGGSDDVAVTNLFHFLPITQNGTDHTEDCLLVIELPERVLYNLRVSLFAILHEMSHIVGYRGRRKRLEQINQAVADHIAFLFSTLLSPQREFFKALGESFPPDKIPTEVSDTLLLRIQEGMSSFRNQVYTIIEALLQKEIESRYETETDPEEDTSLFSREIIDTLTDKLRSQFIPNFECTNSVFNQIYQCYSQMCRAIAHDFSKYLYEAEYIKPTFDLIARRMQWMEDGVFQSPSHLNHNLFVSLWNLFDLLIGNLKEIAFPSSFLIENFIDACFYTMDEGFSDCFAIRMLEMPIEDYLVCHCFMKEGMISEVLSVSDATVLRISCVLQAAFDITESKLSDSIQKAIRQKVDDLNHAHAFTIPLDPQALIEQVETILEVSNCSYSQNKMKEHIVTYLKYAIDTSFTKAFGSSSRCSPCRLLKIIRKLYEHWNIIDTSEIQNQILDQWLRLALENEIRLNDNGD